MTGDYCRLHLRVKSNTTFGQVVAVSGSGTTLGNSNKQNVIPLVTTPESYPIWYTASPIILSKGELVTYRYCLMEGGAVKAFEKQESPRMLIPEDFDTVIEDSFVLNKLEGFGQDSELKLFEQMKSLTKRMSEAEDLELLKSATSQTRLFLVCYHLPVIVKRTNNPSEPFDVAWAESLIAKSGTSISDSMKTIWVGTVSVSLSNLESFEKDYLVDVLKNMDCIPVFLDDDVAAQAYYGFCKTVLWPIFHNVDQLDQIHSAWNLQSEYQSGKGNGPTVVEQTTNSTEKPTENRVLEWNKQEEGFYSAFTQVNSIFAKTLQGLLRDKDVVWVHDYHLMQLPQLLRDFATSNLERSGKQVTDIKIIFYLHIPFPTSQIFRTMWRANELLSSMTCADVVGFHAFDHARHFLNATKRMLGMRSRTRPGGMLTLTVQDREIIVSVSHVSIETERVQAHVEHPDTQRRAKEIKDKYKGRKIIVALDVCQRLSGGVLQLSAFERLINDYYSHNPKKVVLIMRSIKQGSRKGDEETTSNDLKKMISDINLRFAAVAITNKNKKGQKNEIEFTGREFDASETESESAEPFLVVDYEEINHYKGLTQNDRIALWLSADVFLLTPIREGLNLYPLEYIYARKDLPHAGAVVVSEFSTCSSLLNGSIKVNPFAPQSVADAIEKALSLSPKEADYRRQRDLNFICSHPSHKWTRQVVEDLMQLQSKSGKGRTNNMKMPDPLPKKSLYQSYENAAKDMGVCEVGSRVFVFDYGGTLLNKEKNDIHLKRHTLSAISGRKPTDAMMDAIRKLSEDPKNVVMVVTGLTKLKLGDNFNDMNNVTIVTSGGLVYSWGDNLLKNNTPSYQAYSEYYPSTDALADGLSAADSLSLVSERLESLKIGKEQNKTLSGVKSNDSLRAAISSGLMQKHFSSTGREWEFLPNTVDWQAVSDIAMPIISRFTFRTNGTCQTPRIPGIGWSFFGADPDWGYRQADQLKLELEASLANFDVKVESLIQGSIEVVPKLLHKGQLVKILLEKVCSRRGGRMPGFLLVMGDEIADDKMIEAVHEVISQAGPASGATKCHTYTVTVDKRDSPAQFYVNDVQDVERIVSQLASCESTSPAIESLDSAPAMEYLVDSVAE